MSIHPHLLCQAKGTKTRSNTDRIGRNNKCKGRCVLTDNPDSLKRCFMDTARSFMSIHPHFVSIVYFRELRPGERAPWHPTNGNTRLKKVSKTKAVSQRYHPSLFRPCPTLRYAAGRLLPKAPCTNRKPGRFARRRRPPALFRQPTPGSC